MISRIVSVTVVLLAGAMFVLLLIRAQAISATEHNNYATLLRQLEASDARLNESILQVRLGVIDFYDVPNQQLAEIRVLLDQLGNVPSYLSTDDVEELQTKLADYGVLLDQKERLINSFTTENAILNNSLIFFPTLITEITQASHMSGVSPGDLTELNLFAQKVLVFEQTTDADLIPAIETSINTLSATADIFPTSGRAVQTDVETAILHARVILERQPVVNGLLADILAVPILEQAGSLTSTYNMMYGNSLRQERTNQILLSVYIIVLVVGTALRVIFSLRASTVRLDEARALYQGIFNNSTEGIYQVGVSPDGNARLASANPAFAQILGYSSVDALMDATPDVASLYLERKDHDRMLDQLKQQQEIIDLETRVRRADGIAIWTSQNIRLTKSDEATQVYDVVSRDITLQKQLEQRSEALYQISTQLTSAQDDDEILMALSVPLARLGVSQASLFYPPIRGFLPRTEMVASCSKLDDQWVLPHPIEVPGAVAAWLQSQDSLQVIRLAQDNKTLPSPVHGWLSEYQYHTSILLPLSQRDEWLGTLIVAWDKDCDFSRQEIALFESIPSLAVPAVAKRQLVLDLEARVQHRTKEIARKNKQLEKSIEAAETANRAKSLFLANMSHELRTPLNAILGFSQVMRRDSQLSPQNINYLQTINSSGEALLELINDVLDLSKIEAGKMSISENAINLPQMLKQLENLMAVRVQRKGIDLTLTIEEDVPHYITTDGQKLRQVLLNLLSNAVKFTSVGRVELVVSKISVSQTHKPILRFSVRDTGIGIKPEKLETIFEAFTQSDQSEFTQGTGLGLAITREFLQFMGSEIYVDSTLGIGSTFSFDLPVQVASSDDITVRRERTAIGLLPGQPRQRILVVEDQAENRLLIREILSPFDFDLREAINGAEAVEVAREWKPHLIFMDLRMPVMDGYEATQQIKRLGNTPEPIIVALTASVFDHQRKDVLAAGCDALIRKPARVSRLVEIIEECLNVRFVYAETAEAESEATTTAADLNTLPESWKVNLVEAAESADYEALQDLIAQISLSHSQIARLLEDLVANFAYEEIISIVQPTHQP